MLSRIFWVGIAGFALVAGMVLQDGGRIFSWADGRSDISATTKQAIDASVDRAVDRSVDQMQVVGTDGRQLQVSPQAKRALLDAVGRLVKAEAQLATLRIRDGTEQERQAATAARDHARAEVDRLKTEIKAQQSAATIEGDVRDQVREDIRETVRDAVRN